MLRLNIYIEKGSLYFKLLVLSILLVFTLFTGCLKSNSKASNEEPIVKELYGIVSEVAEGKVTVEERDVDITDGITITLDIENAQLVNSEGDAAQPELLLPGVWVKVTYLDDDTRDKKEVVKCMEIELQHKEKAEYVKITAEQAKKILDSVEDYILLDVRTKEEYQENRIEGSTLIPSTELENEVGKVIPDKNTLILVYCRSGARSAASAKVLVQLGYMNVYDFGGIIDWPYGTIRG